ncbi:MAG TPA: leishmanolysin-related zinc metalloendopeptidase [Gemmatimonadaceae bacterium]|nr:leishmanolysin-related zinc metalloendopeptidase [Gemmatimonadaceae bacterium]
MSPLRSSVAMATRATRALMVLALFAAACGEPTRPDPPRATALALTSAAPTTGTAGLPATAITFVVKDQNGAPMGGVPVTITVSGGSTLSGAPTQTASGPTSVGTWTLEPVIGADTLTITSPSLAPITIVVQSVAGAAAKLAVVSGSPQSAPAGRTLTQPIVFSLTDQFGNLVPGGTVTVTTAGGGTTSAVTTDAQGRATTTWTLGKSVVPQTLTGTSGTFTATATATVQTSYKVEVRFFGPSMTAGQRAAFNAAAARLMGMITGDLGNVTTGGDLNLAEACANAGLPTVNEIVDDVVIYASAPDLDGPGGLLGQAGPCLVRSDAAELPVYGTMEFDSADLARMEADGTLTSVILHEMMHVVGIGVYWDYKGLLADKDLATVRFTGAMAAQQCRAEGGISICVDAVPVEDGGGDGTRNSHWRESTFDTEIMTGWENSPIVNGRALPAPISRMTVGSLADIGYVINLDAADTWRIPGTALRAAGGRAVSRTVWEGPLKKPRKRISPTGTVTPIAPR